jgi:hypothetical protein
MHRFALKARHPAASQAVFHGLETLFDKSAELPTHSLAALSPETATTLGAAAAGAGARAWQTAAGSGSSSNDNGGGAAAAAASASLTDGGAVTAELQRLHMLKVGLNKVRGRLDEKDIAVWSEHTGIMLPTGDVVPDIRGVVAPEMCTKAFLKLFEILVGFDLVPPAPASSGTNTGTSTSPTGTAPASGSGQSPVHARVLHLCEAPGGFVSATNHFLRQRCVSCVCFEAGVSKIFPCLVFDACAVVIPHLSMLSTIPTARHQGMLQQLDGRRITLPLPLPLLLLLLLAPGTTACCSWTGRRRR